MDLRETLGDSNWDQVMSRFNDRFPLRPRTREGLRRRYQAFRRGRCSPAASAHCTPSSTVFSNRNHSHTAAEPPHEVIASSPSRPTLPPRTSLKTSGPFEQIEAPSIIGQGFTTDITLEPPSTTHTSSCVTGSSAWTSGPSAHCPTVSAVLSDTPVMSQANQVEPLTGIPDLAASCHPFSVVDEEVIADFAIWWAQTTANL